MFPPEISDAVWKILQDVIVSLITLLLPVLITYLAGRAKQMWAEARSRMTDVQIQILDYIVKVAIFAAEQVGGGGAEKLAYAINVVQTYLSQNGIKLDLAVIVAAIEKAVAEANVDGDFPLVKYSPE